MIQTNLKEFSTVKLNPKEIIIETPRSKRKTLVEMFNCDEEYLKTVRKVICIHPANHSIALFLKMKEEADLCLYSHTLLTEDSSKEFIISVTQKYNYPLVILTRMEDIEDLFRTNGVPTKWRRWCSRMFKIEPARLLYKKFIPSGVIEYMGIQKFHSKERAGQDPNRIEDAKSQKTYKIYRELPVFYETEEYNLNEMKKADIEPFTKSVRSYHRYGCFLCPFAGQKYFYDLKEKDPETYQRCVELMEIASEGQEKRYYYYRKSKIM